MKKVFIWLSCMISTMLLLQACNAPKTYNVKDVKAESKEIRYLDDLLFEGYENLSVDEYRKKIIDLVDNEKHNKYEKLFLDIENNSDYLNLYEPETDEYYVFNVILPTVSNDWLNRSVNAISKNGVYEIEYSIGYSILDSKKTTVKERDNAIEQVYNAIDSLVKESSEKSHRIDDVKRNFDKKIDFLTKDLSNENFIISVDGICRVEDEVDNKSIYSKKNNKRLKPIVDKDSYEHLLLLKTEDISEKTLSDFLGIYIQHIQLEEFKKAQDEVFRSIVENNIPNYLSDEEVKFLTVTLEATSKEFIALYQEKKEQTTLEYRIDNTSDRTNSKDYGFFMNYKILYRISDNSKYKIKDRDDRIVGINDSIEKYVDSKTKEELNGKSKIVQKFLDKLSNEYSNDDIKFEILISSYKVE